MESTPAPVRQHRHRRSIARLSCAALASAVASCSYTEPTAAPMRFHLNAKTVEALSDEPAVGAQILGGLEMLFGTPAHPRYALLPDWKDDGYDPNYPDSAADDGGSGEFTDEHLAAMRADNQRAFARQLEAIAQGRTADVPRVKAAPALTRAYEDLVARQVAGELTAADFKTEATELFANYYPSLTDSAELYREQCLHCHGVEGGGDGPTAAFLDPRPRDYRKGIFKFTAVKDKARPRRQDIARVLEVGVYATAMPSFKRFSIAQREGLVDYVRLLAVRGEIEHRLVSTYEEEETLSIDAFSEAYTDVWEKWQEAKTKVVAFEGEIPPPTEALLARGRELFNDAKKGNCASCHGERGLGDGVAAFKLDDHGERVSAYVDDWGHSILPRNLRQGLYRGGHRPIDIYRRIYAGINGGPMPAIGESKDAQGNPLLSSTDMWALVHYVRSLAERDESVLDAASMSAASHGGASNGGAGTGGGH